MAFTEGIWESAAAAHSVSDNLLQLAVIDDPIIMPPFDEAASVPSTFASEAPTNRDLRGLTMYGRLGAIAVGIMKAVGTEVFFDESNRVDSYQPANCEVAPKGSATREFVLLKLAELTRIVEDCKLGVVVPMWNGSVKGGQQHEEASDAKAFDWYSFSVDLEFVMASALEAAVGDTDVKLLRGRLERKVFSAAASGETSILLELLNRSLENHLSSSSTVLSTRVFADVLSKVFERSTFGVEEREKWLQMLRSRSFVDEARESAVPG